MNRRSRPSAIDAAETLLEAGRTQPVLHYDVELGLERHHHWLSHDAPMPDWASSTVGTAAKSLASAAIKTIVSVVLIGALGVAVWQARGRPQPSAAATRHASPAPAPTHAVAPSARAVTGSDAWLATTPIPVSQQSAADDRATITHAHEHTTHPQRTHKRLATVPAASARAVPADQVTDTRSAAVERPAATTTAGSSVAASSERAADRDVASAEPKPSRPQAQQPDDLAEMQQVAAAEKLLDRSPQRALALVRQGDQRFASGYFQQERAYIAIMALIRLGRIEEARVRAASFAKQFPPLPYGARIRSALAAH